MTQTIKTLLFVVMAAISIGVAAGTYYANRPVDLDDFVDVGEKFYPNFEDPNEATGLQVAAYQEETGKTELFKVDVKNGLWRIPTHHDYPADAQDRLSKAAASMVGVTRLALGERTKAAHKKYDLIDPLDKDASTEGRGDRVTLYKGDAVLVDFIVGKKVENSNNLYYVRRADEDRFYTADLGQFDVSTKFSDWIKQDVLEIRPDDVKEILIGRYFVDEVQGKVVPQETIDLKRGGEQGEWELEGLKKDKEKLKASEITNLVSALDGLQIVGVRPKPPGLSAALKGDADTISIDPFVQRDMVEKGVFINRRNEFVYNEGKVNVGLNNGVNYELGFGEEFTGSEFDIEVGQPATKPAEEAAKIAEEVEKKDGEKKEDGKPADDKQEDGKKTSRYLFVTAFFDKDLLGPAPTAPVKPEPPKEEAKPEEPKADESKSDEKKADTAKADAKPEDAEKKDEKPSDKPAEKPVDKKAEYEKALEEFKIQSEVYELQKKDYEAKVKAGEERVAELNRRFADWYYVIPEDLFLKLKLQRANLVEAAPAQSPDAPKADGTMPAVEKPAVKPADPQPVSEKPEAMKPAPEKPADGKPEEKPADAKPAAEKAPAGDKAEMKAPADEKKTPQVDEKKPEPTGTEESKPAASESKEEPKPAPAEPAAN
ncbi:DUF4340 domain-containing protein [Planctomicrobium sp. SH527]|uniref:DUF4340 domain-containing protein n=1 Tax=Planctomicrobium sp. SH527 TaxID=3448123 RepID=UPI003F5B1F46